jgi:hypothetical protein
MFSLPKTFEKKRYFSLFTYRFLASKLSHRINEYFNLVSKKPIIALPLVFYGPYFRSGANPIKEI